ncbi:MAG TPA: DUF6588 family protein [Gemmatimonadaceae bacterium]
MTSGSKRRLAAITGVALALVSSTAPARGQSGLESAIQQYSGTSIRGYIQPLADALVANLSLGYINSSAPPGRFSLSLEAVVMTAAIDESMRLYTASTPPGFQPATVQSPTIFGGTAPTVNHSTIPGLSYRGSDGLVDAEYFPTAGPQLRLGGILGTELVVRYASSSMVPFLDEEDFPELKIFGFGLQHSLTRYFKGLPVDLSIGGSFNSLTFGDVVDLSSNSFGVNVGKSFGLVGVSGGLTSESGTMTLSYTSTDPDAPGSVDVDLDVKRALRFRAGASLSLSFFRVFGDAAFGDVTSYAGGIRFGF